MHMIGKTQMAGDLHACGLDLLEEMRRVPQSGADQDPHARKVAGITSGLEGTMSVAIDVRPHVTTDRVRRTSPVPKNQILDLPDGTAGTGDHHDVGALQRTGWLTQPPVGQEISVKTGTHRVDQNDVEIPMEPSMLKTIVENQDVEASGVVLQHPSGDTGAIGADEKRKFRMSKSILGRLVGPPRSLGSIPTQGDRGTGATIPKCLSQMAADRGLAGTAHGQVADGYDRHVQTRHTATKLPSNIESPADPIRSRSEVAQRRQGTGEWSGSLAHSLVVPSSSSVSGVSRLAAESCSRN